MAKNYNTTDLDPETTFERHVYHRDQFAHYLRWTHILRETGIGEVIVDFGCGRGNLLEVFYRNRLKAKRYVGLDIRAKTIKSAAEHFKMVPWAEFHAVDLVKPSAAQLKAMDSFKADKVCSFEVMEHVGKNRGDEFCENLRRCGSKTATYYVSTPNFDENVGSAGNHTYDSGDGDGVKPQEYTHKELEKIFSKHFKIVRKFGTFASVRDYKPLMNDWQRKMFAALQEYYDANLVSNIMAPLFPANSRNTMWILKRKDSK